MRTVSPPAHQVRDNRVNSQSVTVIVQQIESKFGDDEVLGPLQEKEK